MMAKIDSGAAPQTNGNGSVKWLGVPVTFWFQTIEKMGAAGIALLVLCLVVWKFVFPLIDAQTELVKQTTVSVKELSGAADEMKRAAESLQAGQAATNEFRASMREEHNMQREEHAALQAESKQMLDDHRREIEILTGVKPTSGGG